MSAWHALVNHAYAVAVVIAVLAVILGASFLYALARTGKGNEELRRRRLLEHLGYADQFTVGDGMPHIAMRAGMTWPDDLCSWPPCKVDHLCTWHARQLRGKHHPPPLTYDGEPIVAVVTDLPEPSDPRWSR